MTVKQVSVFLENKPGHLEEVLRVFERAEINIVALTIAESSGYGLLRMIVDKPEEAVNTLRKNHITCSETSVLGVEIQDTPGALLAALQGFKKRNLNIEYLYTFAEKKHPDRVVVIFRFDDMDTALETLHQDGFTILSHKEMLGD